jgi:uncharacterized membrane protein YphA (DoxX/SURF4 family)
MKPRLLLLARCLLGGTFLLAGALKLTATPELAQTILNYRLLPEIWVGAVAAILPCLEIIPALTLLAGIWLESSAALLGMLSLIFAAAVTSVVWRHIDITCGCFRGETHASYGHLALNLVLLALAVLLARQPTSEAGESPTGV